ncbi:hypothetical protein VNO78_11561 [Psophocarpus tetragonolobus]|uniref:Uncharacterized protein n=1 Tax=Psophocarpus tetragonolobus TaxID=3891 RepID=A0AAN9SLN6_PSOTE
MRRKENQTLWIHFPVNFEAVPLSTFSCSEWFFPYSSLFTLNHLFFGSLTLLKTGHPFPSIPSVTGFLWVQNIT